MDQVHPTCGVKNGQNFHLIQLPNVPSVFSYPEEHPFLFYTSGQRTSIPKASYAEALEFTASEMECQRSNSPSPEKL